MKVSRTLAVLGIAAGAILAIAALAATSSLLGPDTDLVGYPEEAVAWMEDHDLLGPDSRVAARDFAGNYLEAHSGTDVQVFIDDRYDMFPLPVIQDYMALNHADEDWEDVVDRYEPTAILWDDDTDLWDLLADSARWEVVHQADGWRVAVPR